MEYSLSGRHLTEQFEDNGQPRLVAYQDSRGVWTIATGHTAGVVEGMTCTPEQGEQWLIDDLAWAQGIVNRYITVTITQGEYDAMVDFTFNLGAGNFEHSTLLELVNDGKIEETADEFDKWDHCGGKVVAGLLRRRQAEKLEFEGKANA